MTRVRTALSAACAVVGLLCVPAVALAGETSPLVSSVPGASTSVMEPPERIEMVFTGTVQPGSADVALFDTDRREVVLAAPSVSSDGTTVTVDGLPDLRDGTWVVTWSVMFSDGTGTHQGSFPFQVGEESDRTDYQLEQILAALRTESDLGPYLGVARLLALFGGLVLAGSVVFLRGSPVAVAARTAMTQMFGVLALVVGSAGVVVLRGAHAAGSSWGDVGDSELLRDTLTGRIGASALVGVALSAGWLIIVGTARVASPRWWNVVAVGTGVATVVSLAIGSGTAPGGATTASILVGVLHLGATAAWIGGLVSLVLVGADDPHSAPVVARVGTALRVALPAILLAGGVLAPLAGGGWDGATEGTRGTALVVKLVLMSAATLAVLPLVRRAAPSASRRRCIVATVLAVATMASSVGLSSAAVDVPDDRRSFGASLVAGDVVAELAVLPAAVGTAEVHVYLSPPGGMLAPVEAVTTSMAAPALGLADMPVVLVEAGPNHWTGVVLIPYAGDWRLDIASRGADGTTSRFTTVVPVSG